MISKQEIMQSVLQGNTVLNLGNNDVGYLRFLIGKMTYQLAGILSDELEIK